VVAAACPAGAAVAAAGGALTGLQALRIMLKATTNATTYYACLGFISSSRHWNWDLVMDHPLTVVNDIAHPAD
jgi:hypothetical protein